MDDIFERPAPSTHVLNLRWLRGAPTSRLGSEYDTADRPSSFVRIRRKNCEKAIDTRFGN